MRRASHVKTHDVYEVPLSMLGRCRDGGDFHLTLDDSSLRTLRRSVHRRAFEDAHKRIKHWPSPASTRLEDYNLQLPKDDAEARAMFTPINDQPLPCTSSWNHKPAESSAQEATKSPSTQSVPYHDPASQPLVQDEHPRAVLQQEASHDEQQRITASISKAGEEVMHDRPVAMSQLASNSRSVFKADLQKAS